MRNSLVRLARIRAALMRVNSAAPGMTEDGASGGCGPDDIYQPIVFATARGRS